MTTTAVPRASCRYPAAPFVARSNEDRRRRPIDIALVATGTTLTVATAAEVGPGIEFFDAATALAHSLPGWIVTILGGVLAAATVLVVVIAALAAAAPAHRLLLRDLVIGGVAATASALLLARLVTGAWPGVEGLWDAGGTPFPELRMVLITSFVLIADPFVVRPLRRLGRAVLALGAVAAVALELGDVGDVIGALGLGMVVAGAVHTCFGSPGGAVPLAEVARVLASRGIDPVSLTPGSGRAAGPAVFHVTDVSGELLTVEAFGRDAANMRIAAKAWRLLWYRNDGPFIVGRLQQAEHQALMGLLCGLAGATVPELVFLAETERGDVISVTKRHQNNGCVHRWTPDLAVDAWQLLDAVHRAGVTHGSIDQTAFTVDDHARLRLASPTSATLTRDESAEFADRAGLLVLTCASLGPERALDAAMSSMTSEQLERTAPLLQAAAITPLLRAAVRREDLDLVELRRLTAERCGTELPPLRTLRRVTPRSVLSLLARGFVIWLLVGMLAGVDLANIAEELAGSSWSWVAVALLVGQLARLGGAVSILGASGHPLALGPTWLLQMAISFINMAVPGSAARLASVMRFFQKQGANGASALSASLLDTLSGLLVQLAVLLLTLGFGLSTMSFASVEPDLQLPGPRLLALAAALIGVVVIVVTVTPRLRDWVLDIVRQMLGSLRGLTSTRRAGMLFGGNLAAELLSAAALGLCVVAVGRWLPFVDLLAISVVVALFAGLVPVPGGIGVTEAALAGSLTLAGLPTSEALAAALLYRGVTFYLPPLWGFVAMRWLTRHDYL